MNLLYNLITFAKSEKFIIPLFLVIFSFYNIIFSQEVEPVNSQQSILAFISDTQEPTWFEQFLLKSNNNEKATAAIFSKLLSQKNLSALFHLGDLTVIGSWSSEWENIDSYFSKFKKFDIPIYPVLGNHDYYIDPQSALFQFTRRFPGINKIGYSVQIDNIAVVLLNSNFSRLSEEELEEQKNWYVKVLSELNKDSTVNFIIVGTHYSPYTNSIIVEPSEEVQDRFVQSFLKNDKCKLFLSGHSHSFEHFRKGGKDFLVIGGGGGLQHPLLMEKDQRWKDLFPISTSRRMFHFLLVERKDDELYASVIMLNQDFKTFRQVYQLKFGSID